MPTYEYKCEQCGDRFEVFQSMTAPRLTVCEKCGGALRRLIGEGAGVIFKGSGFYCTDYHGKNASMTREHATKSSDGGHGAGCSCGCHDCPKQEGKA